MITGIVVALSEEVGTLTTTKLGLREITRLGDNILVINAGAGSVNASSAAENLLKQGATKLISWGCAAGLSQPLQPGTLILTDQCICADGTVIKSDQSWLQHVQALLADQRPVIGTIAEANEVVRTSEEKLKVGSTLNAQALDMESAAVARVAKVNNLLFLAIRAIADPQTMNLPHAVINAVDEQGQVAIGKLLSYLFAHPGELPALIQLGRHFNSAKKSLRQTATKIDKIAQFGVSSSPQHGLPNNN